MARGDRTDKQRSGAAAERLAEQHLAQAGLRTLTRNWSCRMGEIDLIMKDGSALVFVEVRRRRGRRHGTAAASVGPRKQARLIRAAQLYLQRSGQSAPCRFDVVAVDEALDGSVTLEWIRAAFDAA